MVSLLRRQIVEYAVRQKRVDEVAIEWTAALMQVKHPPISVDLHLFPLSSVLSSNPVCDGVVQANVVRGWVCRLVIVFE